MTDAHDDSEPTGFTLFNEALNRQQLSRRFFLDMVAGTAVYVSLPTALDAAVGAVAPGDEDATKSTDAHGTKQAAVGYSDEEKLPKALDLGSALLVAGTFSKQVMHNMLIKGEDLDLITAMKVNGAHATRVALLRHFGNAEGKELAKHEDYEWSHGLTPVPLLVALSTFTTADLKANYDKFFPVVEKALEPTFDYSKVDPLPIFADNLNAWKARHETVCYDITGFAARVAAVTGSLAPVGTTYLSSALANTMKAGMLRMLYEQALCREVITWKEETGSAIKDFTEKHKGEILARFRKRAREHAYTHFHGPMGFSNLMTALPANANGMWGIGDPPEIFAMLSYYDRPNVLLGSHVVGGILATVYTIGFMMAWLSRVGVKGLARFTPDNMQDGLKTISALVLAIGRSETYGKTPDQVKAIEEVLQAVREDTSDTTAKSSHAKLDRLLEIVSQSQPPYFHLSSDSYLQRIQHFKGLWSEITDNHLHDIIDPEIFATDESFEASEAFADLQKAFLAGDTDTTMKYLTALQGVASRHQSGKLASMLRYIMVPPVQEDAPPVPAYRDSIVGRFEHAIEHEENPTVKAYLQEQMTASATYMRQMENVRPHKAIVDGMRLLLKDVDGTTEGGLDAKEVRYLLTELDEQSVEELVMVLNGADHPARNNHELGHFHPAHEKGLLSPEGREVLFALLTQIPAVPALSRLARLAFDKAFAIEPGQKPEPAQLQKIINYTLFLNAAMSGTADNVAAYLFSATVMLGYLKNRYGENILDDHPRLGVSVIVAALKVAEAAGALTKVGNGPNMSQKKIFLEDDPNCPEQVGVTERDETTDMMSSIKNGWAGAQVLLTIAIFSWVVNAEIDAIEAAAGSK
ncbi:MAG: hypothetical protein HQL50_08365 [Magnetococcales bacterium]|nr:hypothetical protein [Magnetococcales bacterium]